MSYDKKDKIIYGLIVAVVILFANYIYSNNIGGFFDKEEQVSLLDEGNIDKQKDKDEINNLEEKSPKTAVMKVHIAGEIKKPGVYEIKEGDRLEDLIKVAGGLTDEADDVNINLAQRLEDQMKIYIPNKNDEKSLNTNNPNQTNDPVTLVKGSSSGLININTASKEELMTLPNIGEKRADAIIEYRNASRFENIEDIKNVKGIGDKFFEALKDLITI